MKLHSDLKTFHQGIGGGNDEKVAKLLALPVELIVEALSSDEIMYVYRRVDMKYRLFKVMEVKPAPKVTAKKPKS